MCQTLLWKGNESDCGYGTTHCDNREFALFLNRNGSVHFASTPEDKVGAGQLNCSTSPGLVEWGKWNHAAGVIDADLGVVKVYVKGYLAKTCPYTHSNMIDTNGPFRVGYSGTSYYNGTFSDANYKGDMASVSVFGRALSDEEIQSLP